jgi:AraC-like DNA-binding protein
LLPEGEPTLERVAHYLSLSVDELSRRWRGQEPGFGELLDQERKRLARVYVESGQYALAQVAQMLGYSEQSAFTRAFRRWYGLSPRAFVAGRVAQ